MTTSALVLTIDAEAEAPIRRRIAGIEGATAGPRAGSRLPLVLTSADLGEAARQSRDLLDVPGVQNVELVFVSAEEPS